jgi:putative addiction module component (TIGR02574 family)
MGPKGRDLLHAALELPEGERAIIAERLLETLSPEDADPSDDDLAVELDRRLDESQRDPSTTLSWTELRDEISFRGFWNGSPIPSVGRPRVPERSCLVRAAPGRAWIRFPVGSRPSRRAQHGYSPSLRSTRRRGLIRTRSRQHSSGLASSRVRSRRGSLSRTTTESSGSPISPAARTTAAAG